MKVEATAPSNIALIKYMGKTDVSKNRPTNSSLSFTLDNLITTVEVEHTPELKQDEWFPLQRQGFYPIELSSKGREKFLGHVQRLRQYAGIKGFFRIRSANNFPSDAGIASSASSFAALTKALFAIFEKMGTESPPLFEQADLSRLGSGSSCRSFFGPWALWNSEGVKGLEATSMKIEHQLVIVDAGAKSVSSSDAHVRCTTSALFAGRPERAEKRLNDLLMALRAQDWQRCYEISWAEFWDMHALFETSEKPFGYMRPKTLEILQKVSEMWQNKGDGPIATLDAGANVHLLWRAGTAKGLREQKF